MRLRTKIILVCSLATAAISAGAGSVAIYATSTADMAQVDNELARLATTSQTSDDPVGSALLALDSVGSDTEIGFFSINSDYSPLSDTTSVIIATPTKRQLKLASLHAITIDQKSAGSYRLRTTAMPDDEYVVFATSLTAVTQKTSQNVLLWAAVMGSAIALGALALWLITRKDLARIEVLIKKAKEISQGDFDVKLAQTQGKSELDVLNNSLSSMLETLKAALLSETKEKQKTKDFLADASHELKTPLTVIRGYSELLMNSNKLEPEIIARSQGRIQSQIQRMQALIEDMLLLAELEQTADIEMQRVNLSEVVIMALHDLKTLNPNCKLELLITSDVFVTGSQRLLDQLLANATSNLSKYVEPGRAVTVSLRVVESLAVLQIDDAGAGLPDSAYSQGIQYFSRFDSSRSREFGGSGLGMSIMSAIVVQHGGTFEIKRSHLGGLCTLIKLPAQPRIS